MDLAAVQFWAEILTALQLLAGELQDLSEHFVVVFLFAELVHGAWNPQDILL